MNAVQSPPSAQMAEPRASRSRPRAARWSLSWAVVGLLILNLVQVGRRALLDAKDVVLALVAAAAIWVLRLPLPLVVVIDTNITDARG